MAWSEISRVINDLREKKEYRLLLMVALASFTGLRCSDWQKCRWKHIVSRDGRKPVIRDYIALEEQKTKKNRKIYLGEEFRTILLECFTGLRVQLLDTPLIPSMKDEDRGITTGGANWIFQEHAKALGLPGDVTTHTFRKSFGAYAYDKWGRNFDALLMVQKLFNHSSPNITMRYIGLDRFAIENLYKNLSVL